MKIVACVHRVLDPDVPARLAADGGLNVAGVPMLLDPVDAAALEASVRLAETHGGSVLVLTAGDPAAGDDDVLRVGLAYGADGAALVRTAPANGRAAAAALAGAIQGLGGFDLVLCGARSSDYGGGETAAVLAARLGVPLVQDVVAVVGVEDGVASVQRRREAGYRELVRVVLPAVLAADASIARPRFPTTQARLRARRQSIEVIALGAPEEAAAVRVTGFRQPPPRLHGIAWPEPEMNARERLRFLVHGGQQRAGSTRTVNGDPQAVAVALAAFFREQGFAAPAAPSRRSA
jgi:electron transfer flavoprotein beta subunit